MSYQVSASFDAFATLQDAVAFVSKFPRPPVYLTVSQDSGPFAAPAPISLPAPAAATTDTTVTTAPVEAPAEAEEPAPPAADEDAPTRESVQATVTQLLTNPGKRARIKELVALHGGTSLSTIPLTNLAAFMAAVNQEYPK